MHIKRLLTTLLSLSLVTGLFAGCSHTPKIDPTHPDAVTEVKRHGRFELVPIVGNFVAKRATLSNGLKLVVLEDDASPTFAYQTWMNVGSRNEVRGKTGLAHLFEHMMFKGTEKHPEGDFDRLLDSAGVEGKNAFTSTDHTVYLQELPKEHLDLIINLESDRLVNLVVNEQSFKTEREVVQNERRFRKENSPEGALYQMLFETAFTIHPYHWPVIGYEQDLNIMSAQDARDFYQRYYTPDRATVVVVGDVDANEVLRKVEAAYGKIPASQNHAEEFIPVEPEQTAQRRKQMPLNIQTEKLWMAYKVPGSDSKDAPTLELIQAILTDGMNSRLNRVLVDGGIVSSIGTGSFGLRDLGLFVVMADLQSGKTTLLAEQVILREIERLKKTLVREDEIKRAKNLVRFHFLGRMASDSGRARFLGSYATFPGSIEAGVEFQKSIQRVTPEMIQEVVKKYFQVRRLTVVTGIPKK